MHRGNDGGPNVTGGVKDYESIMDNYFNVNGVYMAHIVPTIYKSSTESHSGNMRHIFTANNVDFQWTRDKEKLHLGHG